MSEHFDPTTTNPPGQDPSMAYYRNLDEMNKKRKTADSEPLTPKSSKTVNQGEGQRPDAFGRVGHGVNAPLVKKRKIDKPLAMADVKVQKTTGQGVESLKKCKAADALATSSKEARKESQHVDLFRYYRVNKTSPPTKPKASLTVATSSKNDAEGDGQIVDPSKKLPVLCPPDNFRQGVAPLPKKRKSTIAAATSSKVQYLQKFEGIHSQAVRNTLKEAVEVTKSSNKLPDHDTTNDCSRPDKPSPPRMRIKLQPFLKSSKKIREKEDPGFEPRWTRQTAELCDKAANKSAQVKQTLEIMIESLKAAAPSDQQKRKKTLKQLEGKLKLHAVFTKSFFNEIEAQRVLRDHPELIRTVLVPCGFNVIRSADDVWRLWERTFDTLAEAAKELEKEG
ncbi:hypothetical protein IWZ01DRAFT_541445 [Phyllosticta capitalensis]